METPDETAAVTRAHGTTFDPSDTMQVAAAAEWLRSGRLLVYPTETFYGIGADPRSADGVAALLAAKGGRRDPLPLIASDLQQIDVIARGWRESVVAERLARFFWPGPLSLVLSATATLAEGVAAEDGSIAVRVSGHREARRLAHAVGSPVISTSANRSGEKPARTPEDVWSIFGDDETVALLDGGETAGGAPSTIVDPRRSPLRVLREGAIAAREVLEMAGPEGGEGA